MLPQAVVVTRGSAKCSSTCLGSQQAGVRGRPSRGKQCFGLACKSQRQRLPSSVIGRQVAAASGKMAVLARAKRGSKNSGGGLTREEEPEDYWMSKAEKDGKSPFQDPLAILIIASFILPFLILAVAIATGYVETG